MNEWADKGKYVWFEEQWMKANNPQWLTSVLQGSFLITDINKDDFFSPFSAF
ncbi:hypothetical protein [Enterobacter sp. Bisph1]|uniref:hypothetical protein n=1 Tax=Enterobacter sp. Bisph1 TaxID=1274399 RepID=UPI000A74AA1F|nr:hypothetical protein [Enterobacter sp. Bisph1]